MTAAAGTADKQREAGGDDVELADLLPRRAPHLLQLLPLPLSHAARLAANFAHE